MEEFSPKKRLEEITARDLLKTDISNISEQEFSRTLMRILGGLERSIEDTSETLTAVIKDIKTSQGKIKSAITEMQKSLDIITMRMEESEDQIGVIENKIMENNEAEEKGEIQLLDHEYRLTELCNSTKHNNIHVIGVPEEEDQERGTKGLFDQIIAENFPNLG